MFLHFKNVNTIHYKESLYSIVVKKNVHKMSSVHGSSVLTVSVFFCKESIPTKGSNFQNLATSTYILCFSYAFALLMRPA